MCRGHMRFPTAPYAHTPSRSRSRRVTPDSTMKSFPVILGAVAAALYIHTARGQDVPAPSDLMGLWSGEMSSSFAGANPASPTTR